MLPDGSYLSRIYADTGARRNRRNGLLSHRAEKWTRFSAPNDASLEEESIGWIPKVESTFGSDALVRAVDYRLEGIEGAAPLYRLVTTILDPAQARPQNWRRSTTSAGRSRPALDELKTHLRGRQIVLREPRRRTWIRCSALIVRAKPSPSTCSSPAN